MVCIAGEEHRAQEWLVYNGKMIKSWDPYPLDIEGRGREEHSRVSVLLNKLRSKTERKYF